MNPTSSSIDQARGKPVPWVIAGFFVSFIVPLFCFVWIAFTHKPSEVTPNAYQKGLTYNATLEKSSAQAALGWQAEIALTGNALEVRLRDRAGKALSGATVSAWIVRPTEQKMDQQQPLSETASGVYTAPTALPAKGLWEVHITAALGDQQFQVSRSFTVP